MPGFIYHLSDLSCWLNEEITGSPELRAGLLLLKNIFEQDIRAALKLIAEILGGRANRQSLLPMAVYLSATRDKEVVEDFAQQVARYRPKLKGAVMETYAETLIKHGEQRGEKATALKYTLQLLNRRIGELNVQVQKVIGSLSPEQLLKLGVESDDFQRTADLNAWLKKHKKKS